MADVLFTNTTGSTSCPRDIGTFEYLLAMKAMKPGGEISIITFPWNVKLFTNTTVSCPWDIEEYFVAVKEMNAWWWNFHQSCPDSVMITSDPAFHKNMLCLIWKESKNHTSVWFQNLCCVMWLTQHHMKKIWFNLTKIVLQSFDYLPANTNSSRPFSHI